ncbi:MAG: energy transducer TonB [Spirochaetes bacterium]|jgi:hypothetical protein|nr:energy transducer TonB [Spirochaetota bacterium]
MEKNAEIKFPLVLLISFFIHLIFLLGLLLPVFEVFVRHSGLDEDSAVSRDIIVNINQDNKKVITRSTLLSDKDSSAKGYITRDRGDNWLNNSRDFAFLRGSRAAGNISKSGREMRDKTGLLVTDNSNLVISIMKAEAGDMLGGEVERDYIRIPDRNSFTRENAIFYSNDGMFSFNTKKFAPFKYFREMKDRIASNWYPPLLANAVIYGYDPMSGSYTPGRLRIMAIPNQMVKLYFTMNRKGDVLEVAIVESLGNRPLDSSCVDSIKNSKTFGKVPAEIKGDVILIRFVFIYYVR